MEIKNLKIVNTIKTKGIALATALMMMLSATPAHANENDVLDYFKYDQTEKLEDILDETKSRDNLEEALETYEKLYKYINNDKKVESTYYDNITNYAQDELDDLLNDWESDIYDRYENTSYFKTVSKEVLGSNMKSGNHSETMDYYEDTIKDKIEDYLEDTRSVNTLKNIMTQYKYLVRFIEGSSTTYGYTFEDLTEDEQMDLFDLLIDMTNDIRDRYESTSYFNSTSVDSLKWIISEENVYNKLGRYLDENIIDNTLNTGIVLPNNTVVQTPVRVENVVINPTNQPVESTPAVENIEQTTTQINQPTINNTINKNWRANYADPSINTTRGSRYDYIPEYVDELNDPYRYTQDVYGYYDQYGNYIPYNQYNNGYVEDYALKYIPR